ncbi:putative membrane protein YczE [Streptomyces olivoverticillatus]|uniref:Putative membrane protein YczE n=1 Tax=Streptomyces olivoverticillatus TaxID=66427 RepID=A0A7W7LRZ2_9ACTN|nr:putative membrane protein YczE [Streptomyces olivoverticillatus]
MSAAGLGSEESPEGRAPGGSRGPHLARRLLQLYAGLVLYGVSAGLQLRAGLGLAPWDVLNQGVARHAGLSIGTASILIGAMVLLLWIPLRQRPGLGTVSNVLVIGLALDATLSLAPAPGPLWARIALLLFAVALCGVATGLYISPRFGPGPRDGLMTGLHRRTGRSVRLVRTCIEVAVLATGFALGGSAGAGTVLYALAIGPLSQFFLRFFELPGTPSAIVAESAPPVTAGTEVPDPV